MTRHLDNHHTHAHEALIRRDSLASTRFPSTSRVLERCAVPAHAALCTSRLRSLRHGESLHTRRMDILSSTLETKTQPHESDNRILHLCPALYAIHSLARAKGLGSSCSRYVSRKPRHSGFISCEGLVKKETRLEHVSRQRESRMIAAKKGEHVSRVVLVCS